MSQVVFFSSAQQHISSLFFNLGCTNKRRQRYLTAKAPQSGTCADAECLQSVSSSTSSGGKSFNRTQRGSTEICPSLRISSSLRQSDPTSRLVFQPRQQKKMLALCVTAEHRFMVCFGYKNTDLRDVSYQHHQLAKTTMSHG